MTNGVRVFVDVVIFLLPSVNEVGTMVVGSTAGVRLVVNTCKYIIVSHMLDNVQQTLFQL
jgi:hypothetical protein